MSIENIDTTTSVEPSTTTSEPTIVTDKTIESGAPADTTPAYTPNFKYKYAVDGGKQAEAEIEDIFKPLVKDADTEKKIRELYEKAYGLDFVKKDRDGIKTWASEINNQYTEQTKALQTIGAYVKHKDYDSFFEVMGIPEMDVIKYALQKVQYRQMPPEQQAAFQQQAAEKQRLIALEMQNQELTQYQQSMLEQQQQFAVQHRESELDGLLQRPDVAAAVSSFDQRSGMAGAFRNEVIRRGQFYAHNGYDAPAQQVVMEVLNLVGGVPQQQQAMQQTAQQKPVLPNITGKGTSPVKKVPKSIAELKQLAAQMA